MQIKYDHFLKEDTNYLEPGETQGVQLKGIKKRLAMTTVQKELA